MSDPTDQQPPPTREDVARAGAEATKVMLTRIGSIRTYEVMESELETLDQFVSEENQAFGFASFLLGVFVSAGITMLTAAPTDPTAKAVYIAVMITSGVLGAWFLATWRRAKRSRPRLLQRIRERSADQPKAATTTETKRLPVLPVGGLRFPVVEPVSTEEEPVRSADPDDEKKGTLRD